ncbi:MAG: homoserine kinase [Actinobacteria bacterium 69-20]|nr:homoserine kinase [Actinomycetota bacterium]OJV30204.1 MAG: homoserine kinase [Actinobacteria bacterium 69-20]
MSLGAAHPAEVRIRVPASSANLGPGYDSFGLALGRYDEVIAEPAESGLDIVVEGVGAAQVPTDESHLVYQAACRAWQAMGEPVPGLRMRCVNSIPHGSGQGSSAAAIVAGILMARALTADGAARLDDAAVFALATEMEGHPDNVAPVLFGGFTIAWMSRSGGAARAVRSPVHPDIRAVVLTADAACATATARAVLPAQVPHADAASNSARAALLVHAMAHDPALLLEATEDWLHQRYREGVMPQTAALLDRLRRSGFAAVLSGAGPSVLLLCTDVPTWSTIEQPGFHADEVAIPVDGATVDGVPFGAPGSRSMLRTAGPHR